MSKLTGGLVGLIAVLGYALLFGIEWAMQLQ